MKWLADSDKTEGRIIPNWFGRFVDPIENIVFLGRLEQVWNHFPISSIRSFLIRRSFSKGARVEISLILE